MTPQEHYRRAELLMDRGVAVVNTISDLADHREVIGEDHVKNTAQMDELGKKAMGIWAQAQVHATLALFVPPEDTEVDAPEPSPEPIDIDPGPLPAWFARLCLQAAGKAR